LLTSRTDSSLLSFVYIVVFLKLEGEIIKSDIPFLFLAIKSNCIYFDKSY